MGNPDGSFSDQPTTPFAMFDGIKILDLSVSTDALLQHDRLLFALPVDEKEGKVLTERARLSADRGLIFTLTPSLAGDRLRCELKGSLHRYYNDGYHNADDFTVADLLTALDELVTTYGIDPFRSRLNNVEFGVNVELPFPVSQVLDNLISYKYRPFHQEPGEGFTYYQCHTQRYVVKLYDKGQQYHLPDNILRFEIKVLKMEYLTRRGIVLDSLADLLTTINYSLLGGLLVETFSEILFDQPTINPDGLTRGERDLYQNGRNPKVWAGRDNELQELSGLKSDPLRRRQYNAARERLRSDEAKFRALVATHRQASDWQRLTLELIRQTWQALSGVDSELLTQIGDWLSVWREEEKRPLLTGSVGKQDRQKSGKLTGSVASVVSRKPGKLTDSSAQQRTGKSGKLTGCSGSVAQRGTGVADAEKPGKLTGSEDDAFSGEIWQINPLSVALICQNDARPLAPSEVERGTPENAPIMVDEDEEERPAPAAVSESENKAQSTRSKAGRKPSSSSSSEGSLTPDSVRSSPAGLHQDVEPLATVEIVRKLSDGVGAPAGAVVAEGDQSRPTATTLRADAEKLARVEAGRRRYAKGSKEAAPERAAHNLRNDESNPRNNLSRRLNRLAAEPGLFPIEEVVRLTDEQQALLERWQGTAKERKLPGKPGSGASISSSSKG